MLTLKPIALGKIRNGGYVIAFDGDVPAASSLWLSVGDTDNVMEVSGANHKDLLNFTNLPRFLTLIGRKRLWGTTAKCRLIAKRGTSVVEQSNEQTFSTPVRPYVGRLAPTLGSHAPLSYTGTPPHYPDGRVLHVPAIDGCHYFAYGGKFETDNKKRGFNCITYVGAVFGVDSSSGAMSAFGTQLAVHCGCAPCDCENKPLDDVKRFFKKNVAGTYFMWSEHHIVLVVNAVVHEFREKRGGYNTQPVADWDHRDNRWWVRRSLRQF